MKKKITLILLLIFSTLVAQQYNQFDVISRVNSSTTALDSAGVFTGTAEDVLYLASITMYVKSNVNGTFLAQFSSNGTNWDIKHPFTYTATDTTTTYYLPVKARYFRLVYTNGTTAQTSFRLQTIYHKQMILPIVDNMVYTKVGSSALPAGASTSAKQDTLIARWNSWLASDWATKTLQQNIRDTLKLKFDTLIAKDFAVSTKQDTMIARWNTWLASDWATATLQGAIRDSIVAKINATNLALVEVNNGIDSLDAVNTRMEANQTNGDQKTQIVDGSNAVIGVQTSPIYTKPDYAYIGVRDSLVNLDTTAYNFNNVYLKGYVSIYNANGTTADTLVIEHYSVAKGEWTNQAIGLRDVLTDYLEADNTNIIIASLATKLYEVNLLRPGNIRVRPKINDAKRRTTTNYLYFRGIN